MSETEVLRTTEKLILHSGEQNEYLQNLKLLGGLVARSGSDEEFRKSLADSGVLELCLDMISRSLFIQFQTSEEESLYVRTMRGVNLLTRNVIAASSTNADVTSILLDLRHFIERIDADNPVFSKCLSSFMEILANLSISDSAFPTTNLNVVAQTFDRSLLQLISSLPESNNPFRFFLGYYIESDSNCALLLNDEAYAHLLTYLIDESIERAEVGDMAPPLIAMWEKLITNEHFNAWITNKIEKESGSQVLKVCQLVVTNKEDWSNNACTILMDWNTTIFKILSDFAVESLSTKDIDRLDFLHPKIVQNLDIISDLAKFHTSKMFMQHYGFSEDLIKLLRAVHENTEASTLKSRNSEPTTEKKVSFPMVKTLIIETLAFICHESFEQQEKIRKLHGLELVLSNCVIDDDNPYIKERSILCLRFLLEKNPENQKFVAELEAKQVVNGDALQEAGYKVSIKDGNIKVGKAE